MEHHTDVSVHFDLQLVPGKLEALQASGALDTKLKLTSKISTGEQRGCLVECVEVWLIRDPGSCQTVMSQLTLL